MLDSKFGVRYGWHTAKKIKTTTRIDDARSVADIQDGAVVLLVCLVVGAIVGAHVELGDKLVVLLLLAGKCVVRDFALAYLPCALHSWHENLVSHFLSVWQPVNAFHLPLLCRHGRRH